MKSDVRLLMEEAFRRFECFGKRQGKTLEQAWIGLGMPSVYKPAVEAGLMVTHDGKQTPRIMHWYVLTPAGVEEYKKMFEGRSLAPGQYQVPHLFSMRPVGSEREGYLVRA